MSIKAMKEEIRNQEPDLPRFISEIRVKGPLTIERSALVFAGSGDSYAAAVFAQELSQGESAASDPYELMTNTRRIRGKTLVLISVSGRTKTNVVLARKAKRMAKETIALTANPKSPLAKECDQTFQLKYRAAGILTSGTVSFTTSLLACASLLGSLPRTVKIKTALTDAVRWAANPKEASERSFLFTGSGVNYALDLYGAAKINVLLGAKAEAVYPEQLGHAKLFTIAKERDFVVCISSGDDKAMETHQLLIKDGFKS